MTSACGERVGLWLELACEVKGCVTLYKGGV